MELKLETFIKNVELVTNIHQQNEAPIVVRLTDGGNKTAINCVGYHRPKYVLLPIQAIWLDLNPSSDTYGSAYVRTHKDKNPDLDVWRLIYFYSEAFPAQTYDPDDMGKISISLPNPATTSVAGIGLLASADPESRVIINGDSRLSDARNPLDHTHEEKPATIIVSGSKVSQIGDQTKPETGFALINRADTYIWDRVKESDLDLSQEANNG